MSIYRSNLEGHDINTRKPQAQSLEPVQTDAEQQKRYEHLRKGMPANTLLVRTREWAARLPEKVRPTALLRDYARIANLIALAWDDSIAFNSYMDSLLTDRRGNRRGFQPDVRKELSVLAELRYQIMRSGNDDSRHGPPR
jgi:hypothetical protein